MLVKKHKIILLIIFLASIPLWIFYLSCYRSTLMEAGGIEYAQIAENLYSGQGFKTNVILPFRFNFVTSEKEIDNLFYPFKYGITHPLLISIFFKIFGVNDFAVVLSSAIFYFAIILILFIFAKEAFSLKVAILSVLFFIFNPTVLTWVMWGTPDPLFTFLLFLSLLILIKNKNPVFAGFVFSICQITRLHSYFYLLGFFLFIIVLYPKEKIFSMLKFVLGMFPVTFIFLLYQYFNAGILLSSCAGNYLALFTPTYLGPHSLRTVELIPFFEFIITHPWDIIAKIKLSLYNFINFFPLIISPYLMSFFIGGLFFGYSGSKKDKYKLLIIFFIFSTISFYLISIGYLERYILTLLPFIIIIASDFIITLFNIFIMNYSDLKKKLFFLVLFSFLIIPYLFFDIYELALHRKGINQIKELHNAVANVCKSNFKEDGFILSDSPWIVAWYGKRECIWLPLQPTDIKILEKKVKIKGIILTSLYVPQTELDTPSLWLTKFIEPKGKSNWTGIFEGKEKLTGFGKRNIVNTREFSVVYFRK